MPAASRCRSSAKSGAMRVKRQAGHEPMSEALRRHLRLERQRHERQGLEAAILVIGLEQPVERQKRGKERRHPQDPGGDPLPKGRARARRRTETGSRSARRTPAPWQRRRPGATKAQIAADEAGKRAHANVSTPARAAKSASDSVAASGQRERRVGRQHDPPARVAMRRDRVVKIGDRVAVETRQRLVEEPERSGACDEPRQRHAAALPGRKEPARHFG